jgi:hypothetical protein
MLARVYSLFPRDLVIYSGTYLLSDMELSGKDWPSIALKYSLPMKLTSRSSLASWIDI